MARKLHQYLLARDAAKEALEGLLHLFDEIETVDSAGVKRKMLKYWASDFELNGDWVTITGHHSSYSGGDYYDTVKIPLGVVNMAIEQNSSAPVQAWWSEKVAREDAEKRTAQLQQARALEQKERELYVELKKKFG